MFLAAISPMDERGASPDAALVRLLLQNDVNAFEKLYDKYSRIVYSLVLRIVQQAGPAEEVVQDVFLQLWRNSGAVRCRPRAIRALAADFGPQSRPGYAPAEE